MPVSDDKDLWVSWEQYAQLIEKLALTIYESGWQFDQILCLARGGLRPGDVLSRIFNVPLAVLSTSSYREDAGTVQGALDIAQYITVAKGPLSGRVLLVDDLVDSGGTFSQVCKHLQKHFPAVTEIRTAVLWYKATSVIKPDYYCQYLSTNPWIHQPFEVYDSLRAPDLKAWMNKGNVSSGE